MTASRRAGWFWVVVVYLVATLAAVLTGFALAGWHPIAVAAIADVVATAVVFGFSHFRKNASLYDPYWSVAPVPIALYWLSVPLTTGPDAVRPLVVMALVSFWAVRLTMNWGVGWEGLSHEDWRYRDLQVQTGVWWPVVNFLGVHLFPTILVFVGCLSLWPALTSATPFGWLDVVAVLVTLIAVIVEMVADLQRRAFSRAAPSVDAVLESGLWAWTRHPNYLGEIGFWCGLFLFAVATGWQAAWTAVGPVVMFALFLGISIPMMERRQVARRPSYRDVQKRVPVLIPWKVPSRR